MYQGLFLRGRGGAGREQGGFQMCTYALCACYKVCYSHMDMALYIYVSQGTAHVGQCKRQLVIYSLGYNLHSYLENFMAHGPERPSIFRKFYYRLHRTVQWEPFEGENFHESLRNVHFVENTFAEY